MRYDETADKKTKDYELNGNKPPPPSFSSGAAVRDEPWPLLRLLSLRLAASFKVSQLLELFMGWGRQPPNLEG
jgi:hypothetical protein